MGLDIDFRTAGGSVPKATVGMDNPFPVQVRAPTLLAGAGLRNTAPGDNIQDGQYGLQVFAFLAGMNGFVNGSGWDQWRNNAQGTLLASAARTATITSADQTNTNGRRLLLTIDVSAQAGGSVTPSLQIQDPGPSGNWVTVWTAAAALTAVGTYAYYFADGASGGDWTE